MPEIESDIQGELTMHVRRNQIFSVLFFVLLLFAVSGCAGIQESKRISEPTQVCILFFNDLHGHLLPFEVRGEAGQREVGGISRMAALIKEVRAENSINHVHTLVLVAGDILQGTPMSTVFQGEPDVLCLNAMGIDAMAVGNHEFDFGMANFLKLKAQAYFPFLSANIVKQNDGQLLCPSHATFPLNTNLSFTVIGVTTRSLLTTTRPDNVASLKVLDSVTSVSQVYDSVKDQGPVLLLSHSRHQTDRDIATALPDLAAIIGGHDQILLSPYRNVGRVPVFQAFEKGRYLGRIDFSIDASTKRAKLIGHTYIPVTADIPPEPEVETIVNSYHAKLGNRFREVIGQSATFMDGERDRIRYEETGLGNFITDIMVTYTGARIGLINSGAIRSSIKKGPVTVEDVFRVMPYENELVMMDLTGAEIEQAMNRSVSASREEEDGGFLHVSGIFFDVKDHLAKNICVGKNRVPLSSRTIYRVVLTDFLASGGDGHETFKDKPLIKTGLPLRELMVDTIKAGGVIHAETEGRIRRLER
ncbi:MAG: 5'-nucleotidase C-terminal domain-containing protein [Proteobacteria bacterium]|nr:5'-nucleotidase C-terminal domain-containing protein [Pseudomonadota bacterium]